MKSQMKTADKSGARVAVIIGEDEVANGTATVRHLRSDGDQETVRRDEIGNRFFGWTDAEASAELLNHVDAGTSI